MTKEEILNMPAGDDLDGLIQAEFHLERDKYSVDGSAALKVWRALNLRGVWLSVSDNFLNSEEKDWLKGNKIIEFCKGWDADTDYIEAETIPLGICRVALLVTITTP